MTEEDVIAAFRVLFRREPENRGVIDDKIASCRTLDELIVDLVRSREFRNTTLYREWLEISRTGQKKALRLRTPWGRFYSIMGYCADNSVAKMIDHNEGLYEPGLMTAYRHLLSPDDTCLDIGANIGAHSIVLAEIAFNGVVYAFEPVPDNLELLKENTSDFLNVYTSNFALMNKIGHIYLDYTELWAGDTYRIRNTQSDDLIKVPATTIDDWCNSKNIERLDFIKIDVEGMEPEVILGADRVLSTLSPILSIELFPFGLNRQGYSVEYILQLLRNYYVFIYSVMPNGSLKEFKFENLNVALMLQERITEDLLCTNFKLI